MPDRGRFPISQGVIKAAEELTAASALPGAGHLRARLDRRRGSIAFPTMQKL